MARPQQISTETLAQTLAVHSEVIAADLADALGIGQSTAAKHLAALEAAATGLPVVASVPSCTTTGPLDPARPSGRARSTRASGGPKVRRRTRSPPWLLGAEWSWSGTSPVATGLPVSSGPTQYPAAYGYPTCGVVGPGR
jgi:hypothetical protein